jgi:hypothetical protein
MAASAAYAAGGPSAAPTPLGPSAPAPKAAAPRATHGGGLSNTAQRSVKSGALVGTRQEAARGLYTESANARSTAKRLASEQKYAESARMFGRAAEAQAAATRRAVEASQARVDPSKTSTTPNAERQRVLARGLAVSAHLSEQAARTEQLGGERTRSGNHLEKAVSARVVAARAYEDGGRPADAARQYTLAAKALLDDGAKRLAVSEPSSDRHAWRQSLDSRLERVKTEQITARRYLDRAVSLYRSAGQNADAERVALASRVLGTKSP